MSRTRSAAAVLLCMVVFSMAQSALGFMPGGCMRGPDNVPLFDVDIYAKIAGIVRPSVLMSLVSGGPVGALITLVLWFVLASS